MIGRYLARCFLWVCEQPSQIITLCTAPRFPSVGLILIERPGVVEHVLKFVLRTKLTGPPPIVRSASPAPAASLYVRSSSSGPITDATASQKKALRSTGVRPQAAACCTCRNSTRSAANGPAHYVPRQCDGGDIGARCEPRQVANDHHDGRTGSRKTGQRGRPPR
jgi:hypothetical protein